MIYDGNYRNEGEIEARCVICKRPRARYLSSIDSPEDDGTRWYSLLCTHCGNIADLDEGEFLLLRDVYEARHKTSR